MGGERLVIIFLCAIAVLSFPLLANSYPPLLPFIKADLSLSYTEVGSLTFAYFLGYTLGQIPWGYLADALSAIRVLPLSMLGISFSMAFFSLSSTPFEASICLFLGGFLGAGIFVPGVRIASESFPQAKRGLAIGLMAIGSNLGAILSAFLSPLLGISLGWRMGILILALSTAFSSPIIGLGLSKYGRSSEERILGEEGRRERDGGIGCGEGTMDFDGSIRNALRQRSFWLLALGQFVRLGSLYTLSSWLPLYLHETRGLEPPMASLSVVLLNAAGLISNPVGGALSSLLGEASVMALSFALFIPCLCLLTLPLGMAEIWILILALGWLTSFTRGPIFAILPRLYGVRLAGRASGYQNTFAALGSALLPLVLGMLRDGFGSFEVGWLSLATFQLFALMATIALRSRGYARA